MPGLSLPEYVPSCRKCMDRGFTNADEMPADAFGGILAKIVFDQGIPCDCLWGREFAMRQKEWLKPIPGLGEGSWLLTR